MSGDAGRKKVCNDVNIRGQLDTRALTNCVSQCKAEIWADFCPPLSGEFLFSDICVSASSAPGRGKVSSLHRSRTPPTSTSACCNSSATFATNAEPLPLWKSISGVTLLTWLSWRHFLFSWCFYKMWDFFPHTLCVIMWCSSEAPPSLFCSPPL